MSALLLRIPEVAEQLGLSTGKVRGLIARGELESIKIDKSRRIPIGALEEYVARLRNAGRDLAERTRRDQGLDAHVADPSTLRQVADLVTPAAEAKASA